MMLAVCALLIALLCGLFIFASKFKENKDTKQ